MPRRPVLAALAAGLVALGAVAGCEAPEAPTWNVDLTIPITSEIHTLLDLVDDEEQLGVDSLGTLTLAVEQEIERVTVDDEIQLDPFEDTADATLGPVRIPSPAPSDHDFRFDDLWPDAALWDGSYRRVLPFGFAVTGALPPFDSFTHATFDRARCRVTLVNGLPVGLASATLTLRNASAGTVVGTATFEAPVAPGGTAVRTVALDGVRVESDLLVEADGLADGSGEPVLIRADDQVSVTVEVLPAATVQSALATVAPQIIVRDELIELDGGADSGTVTFADGWLEVNVENQTALEGVVDIILPELLGTAGDTLRGSVPLAAGQSGSVGFDLGGATYEPIVAGQVAVRSRMQFGSGGAQVDVDASDRVRATAGLAAPAPIERFTGVLEPTAVAILPTVSTIDLPEGLDQVSFAAATLVIELENSAGFPVDLDVELVGTNAARDVVIVEVAERVEAGATGAPAVTTIVLDRTNSDIVDLLNAVPTQIELRGDALIGDGVTPGTVARGDHLQGTVTLEAPMVLALGADRLTTDPDQLDIDADARETISQDMSRGVIHAQITNHLPAGAAVHLVLSRTEAGALDPDDALNVVLTGEVEAPEVDIDGLVVAPHVAELELALDQHDLQIFGESPLYTGVVIDLDGTGGQTVRFLASDWVQVRAVAVMRTRVDID